MKTGRLLYIIQRDVGRIICLSPRLALGDMATAIRVYQRVLALGIGTELPL